jgi:RNA polymerase sigma factor (sigma-70 family)
VTAPDQISRATGTPVNASRADGERLFLQYLPAIDRIISIIARRNALSATDADEFAAWARGRLTDADYGIMRKFGGRSSLPTYLSVVLGNLFRDYRNSLWGRWRPSAAAARMGPIGVRLEELLVRDGCPLREAIGILRSAGAAASDIELARMAARLPNRPADREIELEAAGDALPEASPLTTLSADERQRVEAALLDAMQELSEDDQIITKMRFWDAQSVADIARLLQLDQKPLYRRIETIQRRLKEGMTRRGVTEQDARELLAEGVQW